MAKKDIKGNIEEIICKLSQDSTHWSKNVARISWNDNPANIDIRYIKNMDDEIILGKGISLKDEEVDLLVEELIKLGYGDMDKIQEQLKNRMSRFTVFEREEDRKAREKKEKEEEKKKNSDIEKLIEEQEPRKAFIKVRL